jgi:acetoin utilization protein AcuB
MNEAKIRDHMSHSPVSISPDLRIEDARTRMFDNHIRHLIVVDRGHLVGLISERDLGLVASLPGLEVEKLTVGDAMSSPPYTCNPDDSLGAVVERMAVEKMGTAIVMQDGELVGIFTSTDALRVMADQLREQVA